MKTERLPTCAVILAGGRGTRFWPRSRLRTPKQLLNIVGRETMLRQTFDRLRPVIGPQNFWVVTNADQAAEVRRELPGLPGSQILAEPVGRNTAAAIGLAAVHLVRAHGDALMAVLPADHFIARAARYRRLVRHALSIARLSGNLVVMGIPPTRPETGFGYIESHRSGSHPAGSFLVRQFTEKPKSAVARRYASSGHHYWNAGMFFWRASTFLENLQRYLPQTHRALSELACSIGTPRYALSLKRIYPRLENISVDYAVMEPVTRGKNSRCVFVIPAEIGWSDIGSWAAVYELLARRRGENVSAGPHFALDSAGNYLWSPKKFIAAIGVHDLVCVETPDAILLCPRERAQDVGKIVNWLEYRNAKNLI
ncbi:MAG: mannose-1-phosphate guanylyltransferase [Candidatus Acidiferrales bacterium]